MPRQESCESMALQAPQRSNIPKGACRTCRTCRRKKMKCEGQKPECSTCRTRGWDCEYPQDGRKTAVRSKKADIRELQRQIEELKGQMNGRLPTPNEHQPHSTSASKESNSASNDSCDATGPMSSHQPDSSPRPLDWRDVPPPSRERPPLSPGGASLGHVQDLADAEEEGSSSSPEPQADEEAKLQVYGGTSLLHDRSSTDFWPNSPHTAPDDTNESIKSAVRDRLISLAALSRQKEMILCSNPSMAANIDFDGVPMNLAIHLLDLHWNRLHLIYHQTYRPAIMDSLINGGGPYVNKLLLNAIYLQSSLYSDREGLRMDVRDPRTTGMAFYKRFKELVVECIDQPCMPTVNGLLTCGTCLVAYGKQDAGWVYCGMAYRMMVDLGYHLNIPKTPEEGSKFGLTATDIEMRRRIYWGAYVSDKYQSLFLGRLPTLREADSTAPQEYLNSLDEMALWTPYVDPEAQAPPVGSVAYQPQPCYALSTFQALLRLCMIAAQVIDNLYSVKSATMAHPILLQKKRELTAQLVDWSTNLPIHLRFDPAKDKTLPPHQLNLHTTYHTLVILVEQAFLNQVHFDYTLNQTSQEASRKTCTKAAIKIWKILEAYKNTFTLRHAHYGEFYAAYSAVLVILQQTIPRQGLNEEYIECIRFFWMMLSEPQRRSLGFGIGLKKPFRMLKSLIRRNKFVAQHVNVEEDIENCQNGSFLSTSPAWTDAVLGWETGGPSGVGSWSYPDHTAMADHMFMSDSTMFGLFT